MQGIPLANVFVDTDGIKGHVEEIARIMREENAFGSKDVDTYAQVFISNFMRSAQMANLKPRFIVRCGPTGVRIVGEVVMENVSMDGAYLLMDARIKSLRCDMQPGNRFMPRKRRIDAKLLSILED